MSFIAGINPLCLDLLFAGMPRMPGYGEEVFASQFDIQLGGGMLVPTIIMARFGLDSRLGTFFSNGYLSNISKGLLDKLDANYINLYKGEEEPVVITSISTFPEDRCFTCYNPRIVESVLTNEMIYEFFHGAKICFCFPGYDEVFRKLHDEGTIIIFDVGWEDDLSIEKIEHILGYVDIFTPNDKEAMKITNTNTPEEAVKVLAQYVPIPIVKVGAKGCMTYKDGKNIHVEMPTTFDVVDTTGAGDNFLAGLTYGIFQGWDIRTSMQMGNVLGGYSTTALGCFEAMITKEQALDYMNLYEVK